MSVTNELMIESQQAYKLFKVATGEAFAAYLTPTVEEGNLHAACAWAVANLPGAFSSLKEIGAFELSFRACEQNGTLQRDLTWLSRAEKKALFKKFNDVLPAAISKAIYFGDAYSLSDEQLAQLNKLGGGAAFKSFMDSE